MGRFVLVDDEQVPAAPHDVAAMAEAEGFKKTAEYYGFSESTLRLFLKRNGYERQYEMRLVKASERSVEEHLEAHGS